MSDDTRIHLPSTVSLREVSDVVQWVMHNKYSLERLLNGRDSGPIDFTKPTTKDNVWTIKFHQKVEMTIDSQGLYLLGTITFLDGNGERYRGMYHPELYGEAGRLLTLSENPVNRAVGKKLVDFFGGEVMYCDTGDDSSENVFVNKRPLLKIKATEIEKYGVEDARFYGFYNQLQKFVPLTTADLMAQGYEPSVTHEQGRVGRLYQLLKIKEGKLKLDKELPKSKTKVKQFHL